MKILVPKIVAILHIFIIVVVVVVVMVMVVVVYLFIKHLTEGSLRPLTQVFIWQCIPWFNDPIAERIFGNIF